jgi:type IV pilus assembly protein PilO
MNLKIDLEKNKKETLILIGLVSLIVFVVYFQFILRPQIAGTARAVMKMTRARADLASAKSAISNIEALKKDIGSYKAKIVRYEEMLPAAEEIPSLLENLSTMARKSNVKIVGITPMATKKELKAKPQIYKEIPILISAKSGYHELGKFLSNLENSDRFMKIADIEIRTNRSTPKKHDVELLVVTYILLNNK